MWKQFWDYVLSDLKQSNEHLKQTFKAWLKRLRYNILMNTTKSISNVEHIAYRNGALLVIKHMQEFIENGFDATEKYWVWDITRSKPQMYDTKKKTLKSKRK